MKQIMLPSKRNRNCIDLPQLTRMKTLKACGLHLLGLVAVLVKYLQKTDFTQVKPAALEECNQGSLLSQS
jgi:hypothetical protein